MAHMLVTGWYPQNKGQELLKAYTSKDKPTYPDFVKKIHHWTLVSSDGSIIIGIPKYFNPCICSFICKNLFLPISLE